MLKKNKILIFLFSTCLILGLALFWKGFVSSPLDMNALNDKIDSLNMDLLTNGNEKQQLQSYKYKKLILYLYDNIVFQGSNRLSQTEINDCPRQVYEKMNNTQQNITNTNATIINVNIFDDILQKYPNNSFETDIVSDEQLSYHKSLVSLFTGIDSKQLKQLLQYKDHTKIHFRNLIKDIENNSNLQTYAYLNKKYQDIFSEFRQNKTISQILSNKNTFNIQGEVNLSIDINNHINNNDFDVLICKIKQLLNIFNLIILFYYFRILSLNKNQQMIVFKNIKIIVSKSFENVLIEENKEDRLKDVIIQKKNNILNLINQVSQQQEQILFLGLGWNSCDYKVKLFAYNSKGFVNNINSLEIDRFYGSLVSNMNWRMPSGLISKATNIFLPKQQNTSNKNIAEIQNNFNNLIQQYKILSSIIDQQKSNSSENKVLQEKSLKQMNKIYEKVQMKKDETSYEDSLKQIIELQEEIEKRIKQSGDEQVNFFTTISGIILIFFSFIACLIIPFVNTKILQNPIQSKRIINILLELPVYYYFLLFIAKTLLPPSYNRIFSIDVKNQGNIYSNDQSNDQEQLEQKQKPTHEYENEMIKYQREIEEDQSINIIIFMGVLGLFNSTTLYIQQQPFKILLAFVCFSLFFVEGYLQRQIYTHDNLDQDSEQLLIIIIITVRFLYELYSTMSNSIFYLYFSSIMFLLPLLKYFFETSYTLFQCINAINGIMLFFMNRSITNFEEKITILMLSFIPFMPIVFEEENNFFFELSSHIALLCLLFSFAASLKILYLPAFFAVMNMMNQILINNLNIQSSDKCVKSCLVGGIASLGVSSIIYWSKAQQMHTKNFNDLTLTKIFSSDVQSNQSVLISSIFKYNIFAVLTVLNVMAIAVFDCFPEIRTMFTGDILDNYFTDQKYTNLIETFEIQMIYIISSLITSLLLLLFYTRSKKIGDFENASKSEIYETEDIADKSATRKGFEIIMGSEQKQLNNNSQLF